MDHVLHLPFLREALIFLAAAAILIPILDRLRINPVIGFLIAGIVLGPYGLGSVPDPAGITKAITIRDVEQVRAIAEFGVVFLLFSIGLELSFKRLFAMRRLIVEFGTAQILVSAFVIGLIAYAWGNSPVAAIVIGLAFALSSTAVVMPLVIKSGDFASHAGRGIFGVLLAQDVAVAPILVLVAILAGAGLEGGDSPWIMIAMQVGGVAAILIFGRLLVRPMFKLAAATGSRELFLAMAILTVTASAMLTAATGLSLALGAFLSGLILSDTEFRHQLDIELEPLKGLLLGLFFFGIGMGIDLKAVAPMAFWVAASLVGLIVIKGALNTALSAANGFRRGDIAYVGLSLAGAGEFVFIILGVALANGLLERSVVDFMNVVASLSIVATPFLFFAGRRLQARINANRPPEPEYGEGQHDLAEPVLIAGFGRVGQTVAHFLDRFGVSYSAIDRNADSVQELRSKGVPVYYGDATREEMLARLGGTSIKCAVITLDDPKSANEVMDAMRKINPKASIFVRASTSREAQKLKAAGADIVIPETIESSMQLASLVCEDLDIPSETTEAFIHQIRMANYDLNNQ